MTRKSWAVVMMLITLLVMVPIIGCGGGKHSEEKVPLPAYVQPEGEAPSPTPSPTPSPKASALTVLSIAEGQVLVRKANTDSWVPAEAGITLDEDDTIKTAEGGRALITFFEGSTIELEPGTEVRVDELGIAPDSGSTTIKLSQSIGRSVSRVKKLTDSSSTYEVQTPTGVGAVRGSTMLVDVGPNRESIIRNLGGHVSVIFNGVEYPIPEFMEVRISADGQTLTGPFSILSRIEVTPAAASVRVGEQITFSAQGFDTENRPVNGLTYVWACTDAMAGTIDAASGAFTAGSIVGFFPDAVSASAVGVTGFASVNVAPGPPTQISVETAPDGSGAILPEQSLPAGASLTAYAVARDEHGNSIENIAAEWSLADISGGITGQELAAEPDGKSAIFTACAAGTAVIRAEAGTLVPGDSGRITVTAGPLDHIEVTPASAAIISGAVQVFSAQGYDACGNPVPGLSFTWACTDSAAGAVPNSGTGTFIAGYAAGTYENVIRVASGDMTAFASVVITAPAYVPDFGGPAPGPTPTEEPEPQAVLSSIVITPAEGETEVGGTVEFFAQGYDQFGNPLDGLDFEWECLDESAGSIDPVSGVFTAGHLAGSFTDAIRVSAEGIAAFASVLITPGPIAQVSVETAGDGSGIPVPSQTLAAGEPLTAYAVGRDEYGNFVENISAYWWVEPVYGDGDGFYLPDGLPLAMGMETENGWDLQVSEDGKSAVFTGFSTGSVIIWAGAEPCDSASSGVIVIVPGALSSIEIIPSEAWIEFNQTLQFSASGYDQYGNAVAGLTYTWECLDGFAGVIDLDTGLFTAGDDEGEYVDAVRVTSGGVSAYASVYVSPGPS